MQITRQELTDWYNSMTTKELTQKLGYKNAQSLYNLLRREKIPLKGRKSLLKVEIVESA